MSHFLRFTAAIATLLISFYELSRRLHWSQAASLCCNAKPSVFGHSRLCSSFSISCDGEVRQKMAVIAVDDAVQRCLCFSADVSTDVCEKLEETSCPYEFVTGFSSKVRRCSLRSLNRPNDCLLYFIHV